MDQQNPKKILIFCLVYYPRFVGGAEVALKEITDRMLPESATFDMVTLRVSHKLPAVDQIGNVRVYRIGFDCGEFERSPRYRIMLAANKYLFPFMAWRKAAVLNRRARYSATWSMMANYAGFAASFFRKSHPEIPFLLTLQEGDSFAHIKRRVGPLFPLYKMIFRSADTVQAISHYLANYAVEMGFKGEPQVVPNGVDVEHFATRLTDTEAFALKESLGKKYTDSFLITTSRLVPKNGVDLIIRAMQFLPPEVQLLVIGEGEEDANLRALAKKQGVADRVRFMGFVPNAELPKYLHVSDVFVRPSRSEGFGISFVEAMAAGIPVVTMPVGGIVDFIFDPVKNPKAKSTGMFAEPENAESIAQAVRKLLANKSLRDNVVTNASELVVRKYQWNKIVQEMEHLLVTMKRHDK